MTAHELEAGEVAEIWPRPVDTWPASEMHYAATGERSAFLIEPLADTRPAGSR